MKLRLGKLIVFGFCLLQAEQKQQCAKEVETFMKDVLFDLVQKEEQRQQEGINLIASENEASKEIREMVGSCLTNKYVEGNIGARYYAGFEHIDPIESEVINRFKSLFGVDHANVQPHSGTQANMGVYLAALNIGDTILSMSLPHGGHLSHGHPVNIVGSLYNIVSYGVDQKTECIDYDEVERLALQHKPKLIVAGASAYPRTIDFECFAQIAKKSGALLLADIAHIAGLVAAGLHPSPVGFADFITMTTHKTFKGPRGGVIMCSSKWAKKIDKAVMPGMQGGAFMHVIAAKGIACAQAMTPKFVAYQKQVIKNAQMMAEEFQSLGYRIVSGGTDNHLFLIDLSHLNINGKQAEQALERVGIFVNRNTIPFDTKSPMLGSGIRIGTPAITSRGADEQLVKKITYIVNDVLTACSKDQDYSQYASVVKEITANLS